MEEFLGGIKSRADLRKYNQHKQLIKEKFTRLYEIEYLAVKRPIFAVYDAVNDIKNLLDRPKSYNMFVEMVEAGELTKFNRLITKWELDTQLGK